MKSGPLWQVRLEILTVLLAMIPAIPSVAQSIDSRLQYELPDVEPSPLGLWSIEFGVGVISDNTPADYLEADFNKLDGPGGGLTYNITVARRIKQFNWTVGETHLQPQIEVPFRLTIVDDQTSGIIPDFNLGVVFRWRDFPWNRFVYTTLAAGVGLSYSSPVWTADVERHEDGEDRSELKFWMPVELTLSHPRHPDYQLVAFIDHQSGGTIFDAGGVDVWGIGFRFEF